MFNKNKKTKKTKKLGNKSKRNWFIGAGIAVLLFGGVGTYMLTQSNASGLCVDNVYRQNSSYVTCVKYIQTAANWWNTGYGTYSSSRSGSITVDGYFGPKTADAVKRAQQSINYYRKVYGKSTITVDGVVGQQTWIAFCSEMSIPWDMLNIMHRTGIDSATDTALNNAGCVTKWISKYGNPVDSYWSH